MVFTGIYTALTIMLFIFVPYLDLKALRKAIGITLFLEIFYLIGHYIFTWPFPSPAIFLQLFTVVGLGVAVGVIFSRIWPISPQKGFERIVRTLLIVIPSLGLGVGLQVLLQGQQATQAIYLIFALATWLGSGHFVRQETEPS
jgi:hypothetical protein